MSLPITPNSQRFVDAHCHFFNKEVLSFRLLVDVLLASRNQRHDLGLTAGPVQKFLHFLRTGLSSTEAIYQQLEKDERGFAFCPLMFDLDSCTWGSERKTLSSDFDSWVSELQEATNEISDSIDNPEDKELLASLLSPLESKSRKDLLPGQEKQLEDLAQHFPSDIFPFFVVDPRRNDCSDSEELKRVVARLRINGGVFSGIKLYAPCGFSPNDDRLWPLYQYCEGHDVPLTAHCSGSGFATFASTISVNGTVYRDGALCEVKGPLHFTHNGILNKERVGERATRLNHPKLWELVLQRFPKLKLNLAHFGLHDGGTWTSEIRRLMGIYPNLYTDFSCICSREAVQNFHAEFVKAPPAIRSRFLYGSDFYLNLLFADSMGSYLRQFQDIFTPAEWNTLARENAQTFLKSVSLKLQQSTL